MTAATSAKIAMEITVTNQKTKSIRSACLLAEWGIHGISRATAAAPAPKSVPRRTSWTTDPLRTGVETTRPEGRAVREATAESRFFETPATSKVQDPRNGVDHVLNLVRRNHGTRC